MNQPADSSSPDALSPVLHRNIRALLERRRSEEQAATWHEAIAAAITRFGGSMGFVYLHLAVFGGWIAWNLPMSPLPRFDPTFVTLAMTASVEAIFLSTFVLISQNRMAERNEKRADLDLHISLLAEHEITRLLSLTTEIAKHLGIKVSNSPELAQLARDVKPEKVMDTMDQHEEDVLERADSD